jgi:hypothetical protein
MTQNHITAAAEINADDIINAAAGAVVAALSTNRAGWRRKRKAGEGEGKRDEKETARLAGAG